jgi:hypothetical protein
MVFIGAFGVQWGLGLLIDLLQQQGQSRPWLTAALF